MNVSHSEVREISIEDLDLVAGGDSIGGDGSGQGNGTGLGLGGIARGVRKAVGAAVTMVETVINML